MRPVWHHMKEDSTKPEQQPTAMPVYFSSTHFAFQSSHNRSASPAPAQTVTAAVVQAAPLFQAPAEECCT